MGLTTKDIRWIDLDVSHLCNNVIFNCGEFPNVPLIRTKGRINYNPTLTSRQCCFSLQGPPVEKEVHEIVFFGISNFESLKRVVQSWKHIQVRGKTFFGRWDCVSYPSYVEWVTNRAIAIDLPFPAVALLYLEIPELPVEVSMKQFCEVQLVNDKP